MEEKIRGMKSIVLCGGGTAGHIMPNIALIDELKKTYDKIYYMGGANSMEERICKEKGITFYATEVVKFDRGNILKNFKVPLTLFKGIKQAKNILKKIKPSVIFAKGGYASLPTCIAGKSLKIPVICHESDFTLGLANKIISLFSVATFTSFDSTKVHGTKIVTGVPVRKSIFYGVGDNVGTFDNRLPTILVMGGSLGARAINRCLYRALDDLTKYFNVLHISGDDENIVHLNYLKIKYAKNIEDYYAKADLIISRAGATAIAEITALNKKCLLIPLPKGASRGDQILNAEDAKKRGLAHILKQENMTKDTFISSIFKAYRDKQPQSTNKNKSNVEIVKLINKYSNI